MHHGATEITEKAKKAPRRRWCPCAPHWPSNGVARWFGVLCQPVLFKPPSAGPVRKVSVPNDQTGHGDDCTRAGL